MNQRLHKKVNKAFSAMLLSVVMMLSACGSIRVNNVIPSEKIEGNSLYVRKVEDLPDDFIMGMDASSVLAEEKSGVKYYNYAGEEQDVFKTLAESGVNTIRVRVWNDPFDKEGHGYGGGNCTIDTAVEIGKRASSYGMQLLVDFHYSDFWADPGKQMVPKAWSGMEIEEKTDAVYAYTKDCLKKLKRAGVAVGMVQIGNETNGSFCGENKWFDIQYLMQAGSKAVREVFPEALVALHFANPEKTDSYMTYASKLDYYEVDYDVFASSYYPYWHGSLENLAEVLKNVQTTYGKKVMVMETSYAYTAEDTDFNGNTISDGGTIRKDYPFTVQGQANHVRNVIDTVNSIGGIGVVYWEGTWISVGSSWEENHEKWETFGSGWASSYAAEYDPRDAGKYYGGCAVDNQAMFDPYGNPLPSLQIFNLVRYGNDVPVVADALEDVTMFVDLNAAIELPETVNAIMNDDSREAVAVEWAIVEEKIRQMQEGGVQTYMITGVAEGHLGAVLYLSMIEFNYIDDFSFESGEAGNWIVTDNRHADELYIENKTTDSLSGDCHMHFWSAAKDSVNFDMEQMVDVPNGTYKFTMSIMGGDCGDTNIYLFARVDGEEVGRVSMTINGYGNWDTQTINGIEVEEGQTLTVGIHVECSGEGNGAWGKIDDALLNSMK